MLENKLGAYFCSSSSILESLIIEKVQVELTIVLSIHLNLNMSFSQGAILTARPCL